MRILIIGQSQHLIEVVKKKYPDAAIEILAWRSIAKKVNNSIIDDYYDIVFIAGYDYSSYSTDFNKYYNNNVDSVSDFILYLSFSICVYLDTTTSRHCVTYSRYYFAKKSLRNKLIKKYANLRKLLVYEMPTLIHNGNICMNAGLVETFLAKVLVLFGGVKTKELSDCFREIIELINSSNTEQPKIVEIQAKLLTLPRTRFIDRLLRVLYG